MPVRERLGELANGRAVVPGDRPALPAHHDRKAVRRLVDLCVQTVQSFGLRSGVLHVEGKCTSHGPRIIEVNARMGGARIHEIVEAVWNVDLIEAQLRSSLALPPTIKPSRRPQSAAVNTIVYAPATGRLAALPFADRAADCVDLAIDLEAEVETTWTAPTRSSRPRWRR